jgi:hypothetical protein
LYGLGWACHCGDGSREDVDVNEGRVQVEGISNELCCAQVKLSCCILCLFFMLKPDYLAREDVHAKVIIYGYSHVSVKFHSVRDLVN